MAAEVPIEILRVRGGNVKENSYIIKLKEGTDKAAHLNHINTRIAALDGHSEVTHAEWRSDFFHGYAGIYVLYSPICISLTYVFSLGLFSGSSLESLCCHPDIEYIEEDGIVNPQWTYTQ